MSKKDIIVTASVYRFNIVNGEEVIPERMTISGKEIKGLDECIFARTGRFPYYNREVTFGEAEEQLSRWFVNSLPERLKHGESLTLVSNVSKRHPEELESGQIIKEVVYDISHTPNNWYVKAGAVRYKFVYTKA